MFIFKGPSFVDLYGKLAIQSDRDDLEEMQRSLGCRWLRDNVDDWTIVRSVGDGRFGRCAFAMMFDDHVNDLINGRDGYVDGVLVERSNEFAANDLCTSQVDGSVWMNYPFVHFSAICDEVMNGCQKVVQSLRLEEIVHRYIHQTTQRRGPIEKDGLVPSVYGAVFFKHFTKAVHCRLEQWIFGGSHCLH